MRKQTITYTDLNGMERTEDFYFNLSKTELLTLNLEHVNLREKMVKFVQEKNSLGIIKFITDIIYKAYGIKSEDGRRFEKSQALSDAFIQSPAYEVLFMDIIEGKVDPIEFVKGVIPQDLADKIPSDADAIQATLAANN